MRKFRPFACVVAFCLAAAASAFAQRPAAEPKAGGLAVEIVHEDGRRTYIPGNETMWTWRFRSIAGWQRPAHIPPVRAVQVASRVETDETLHITVSVRLGERHLDEDRPVATFVARVGDALVAEGLREFGVVPVELKVVRARTPAPAPPFVEIGVNALELLGVEPADVSFPSYNLRLRNHANKTVAAVEILYVLENDGRPVHWRHNPQNEPLAAPGAIFDLNVFGGNNGEMLRDGYAPDAVKSVRVNTVVFADGTFEGDAGGAAWVNALWRGRKMQLERVLPLVAQRLASPPESDAAVEEFRRWVESLSERIPPGHLDALLPQFSHLDPAAKKRMRDSFEFSLHRVKYDLLDSLRKFEAARRAEPERLTRRSWFEGVRGAYGKWLARL